MIRASLPAAIFVGGSGQSARGQVSRSRAVIFAPDVLVGGNDLVEQRSSAGEWMFSRPDDVILTSGPRHRGLKILVGRFTGQDPGDLPIGKLATQMLDILVGDGRARRLCSHSEILQWQLP